MGAIELKRERHKAMLIWLGKIMHMSKERWPRRVYEEWSTTKVDKSNWKIKSWREVVEGLVKEYRLQEQVGRLKEKVLTVEQWEEIVKNRVEEVAVEDWRIGVLAGRKLEVYRGVKTEWGFEKYLEGRYGKGEILLARFRSGSAGIGEEMARWERRKQRRTNGKEVGVRRAMERWWRRSDIC